MKKKVLIFGNRSFVGLGLEDKLIKMGFDVECFTRGEDGRKEHQITGNVLKILSNNFFKPRYDVVINFIMLKGHSIDDNITYADNLVKLCLLKGVNQLIQISSLMVYDSNEICISESTSIQEGSYKSGYSAIKIAVDKFLLTQENLNISFIRPGFVLNGNQSVPFIKKFPLGFALIKGDKKSKQPIVERDVLQNAIANLIQLGCNEKVYLFVPSDNKTKYQFAKKRFNYYYVFLPKFIILRIAELLLFTGIINRSFYARIEGMYVETFYNSVKTEKVLQIKF